MTVMDDREKELVEQILKKLESMENRTKGLLNGLKECSSEIKSLENVFKKGFSEVHEKLDNIIETNLKKDARI